MKPVYLLTGPPGTGKTSLIKQALADMAGAAGGFYTEEIRNEGVRKGFRLVTLDGETATLAHVGIKGRNQVGRYGVDLEVMEKLAVPVLRRAAEQGQLVVIDEIGRMELLYGGFGQTVLEIIKAGHRVLGTIMQPPHPKANTIKQRPEVDLVPVTGSNNRRVLEEIQSWLAAEEA